VCIGLPADWVKDASWLERARLRLANGKLRVLTHAGKLRFVVDTKTFRVSTR
jgi:hypothetical protein